MLKRTALFLALCLTALISPWAAQAQNTQITASHIAYFGGTTVTGKFCVTPTNQAGQPITIVTPLGQQLSPQVPLCFPITSGVLSNTAIVPDTSLTQPTNACYSVAINDFFGRQIGLFPCVQPSGTTWSFDAYVPNGTIANPAFTLPQFQVNGITNGAQGYLDLICPSCTVSGGHVTLPTGGSGSTTLAPTGPTAGSGSQALTWQGRYNNGSGLAIDTYTAQLQIGSGANPFGQLVFDHPSGTPGGSQYLFLPPVHFAGNVAIQTGASFNIADLSPSSSVCTNSFGNFATSGCTSGSGAMTPAQFGAHGDGLVIGNGCTTNGTTTVVCAAGPFASGDVGKFLCVSGAGAAGVGFCRTISTFVSSTTVTISSTPPTNVTSAIAAFGHDDVAALQSCYNNTSTGVPCVMNTPIGYNTPAGYMIVSAGLTIPTKANIQGAAPSQGTTIISEFDGDALSLPTSTASLQAGQPVEGVSLRNFTVWHDPSWPNGRSFHINAAPGVFGFGGMFNSTISNISSINAAKECMWLDGHINTDNNPNQYVSIYQFKCNGPAQSHPANEIKITGIQAQILFEGGSIDGDPTTRTNYPNPLIWIGEKTSGQCDSPVDVKFIGFTYESGTQGLRVGDCAGNIHYENSYVEAIQSPVILQGPVAAFTYKGNNIANSGDVGGVIQASDSVNNTTISATVADNRVWGSTAPAAFAVCTGNTNRFAFDFSNNISTLGSSANCATSHSGTGGALFQATGTTVTVDPSSVVITTIRDLNIQSGKTLTMKALSGGVGSFSLGTGGTPSGNDYPIDLGAYASPLVVPAGNSVTLALLDVSGTPVYTVVGGTGLPVASLPVASSSGSVNVLAVTQAGAVLTAGQVVRFLPNLANTSTTPTLAVNGLTAKTITKNGQVALAVGDLITTAIATVIYDGTDWELQNPQTLSSGAGSPACGSATGCLALPEGSTAGTPTSGHDYIRADATQHNFLESLNGGAETLLPGTPVAVPTPLTAQAANLSFVTIYTTPAANHRYVVCAEANLTRPATTSSTMVQIQIGYTSAIDSAIKIANIGTTPGIVSNSTLADNSGCAELYVLASTTIQWATVGYVSTGATTMQYSLAGTVKITQ